MDIRELHATYQTQGVEAAHALIVAYAKAVPGGLKPNFTVAHVVDAIRANSDGENISWPRVLHTLANRPPGSGEA